MNYTKIQQANSNSFATFSVTQQIVFIDSQIEDYQSLAAGVIPGTEVVILDANRNGIQQISAVLSQKHNFTSVHIVSHGSPGYLYLGNSELSLDNLEEYASNLQSWFSSSSHSLILYGCNVAAGDAGAEFITKLKQLTRVEIAASTSRTGNAAKGGNWELEYQTREIETSIAFTPKAQQTYAGVLVDPFRENFDPTTNTWTVNPNTTDNATTDANGRWVIGDPISHSRFGTAAFEQLEAYNGTNALVTGLAGTSPFSDVSISSGTANAVTTVRSSSFTLSNSPDFNTLAFRYYLSTNDTSSITGTDSFKVELVKASDNTVLSTLLNSVHAHKTTSSLTRTGAWGLASTSLDAYTGQNVYLRLTATDANNNSILEAGIDDVNVTSLDKSTPAFYTANEKYSLGNRIWNDANNNGSLDTGETGINNVVVNLYKDSNDDGTPDGAAIATDTTTNGGYYRFDNLLADNYIVEVAASNFNTGNPLVNFISSSIDEADPDSNVDKNDNGIGTAPSPTNGIRSGTVTLGSSYIEPTGEADLEPVSFTTLGVTTTGAISATNSTLAINTINGDNSSAAVGRFVGDAGYFETLNIDVTGYGTGLTGFCIEFAEDVTPGAFTPVSATGSGPYYNTSYNDPLDISTFFGVDPNAANYGIITQAELNLISTVWYNKQSTLRTSPDDAAAMQALVWELQNDQIFDLSSGNFYLDPNTGSTTTIRDKTNLIKTTVETWVNNFNTGTWTGSLPLAILTIEDTQDIIVNLDLGVGSTDSQSNLTADFGFTDQIDYGDAPDTTSGNGAGNYTTTSTNGGASHGIVTGLTIGSTIDEDNGTLQNTAANLDDTTNNGATDDEDGVTVTNFKTDDGSYSVTVNLTNTVGAGNLVGWIDFNQDGLFQATEAATTTVANLAGVQSKTLTWSSIPSDIKAGTTYARFRLSTDAALNTIENGDSVGNLTNGEVEDYQLTVTGVDYGDAPDTSAGNASGNYTTTKADGGASHTIVSDLSIGSTVDGDTGTLQNTAASLDDTINNGATDDEDGISSFSTLSSGATSYTINNISVKNNTGSLATLIGWIDFDRDGIFEASEAAIIPVLNNATSAELTWTSLLGKVTGGNTYARFRFSSDFNGATLGTITDALSIGAASNGEVEDYQVFIEGGKDYGDAPDTTNGNGLGDYTTTLANGGASHTILSGLSIGSNIDEDNGTLYNSNATADDNNGSDDEDGVTVTNFKTDDGTYSVTVNVNNTTGSSANLLGWIDFNQDGIFQTTEAATTIETVAANSGATTQTLSWSSVPSDIKAGNTYARFRLSTDTLTNASSIGALGNGEVEDYQVSVTGVDYGDAPDTGAGTGTENYETTNKAGTANDGAAHTIVSGLSIGSSVDGDSGTLQNTAANLDDTTNNGTADDEDGISSFKTLSTATKNYSISVNVNNTLGTDAKLVGWIDFDRSGTFDADEAVTANVANNATQATLTWSNAAIPSDIQAGNTYARFRLSTDSALTTSYSTGAVNNGEVEDYQIEIKNGVTGTDKAESLTGTNGNDLFTGNKGEDTLTGGTGNDCYYFNETSDGLDSITDFHPNEDKIDLSKILASEVTGDTPGNAFNEGYVQLLGFNHPTYGASTIVQIDFDAGNGATENLFHKDVVFLRGVDVTSLDLSRDFII